MPEVSVIIPVYKVETYLRRCLDSVAAQTFKDWEAICVDDGSPDSCPSILEEYSLKDNRFKVLHKENGGLSSARNAAMPLAQGNFIVFLDSDDFLHPQTLEICTGIAIKDNSDIVAYTYDRTYRAKTIIRHILHIPERKSINYKSFNDSSLPSVVTDDIFDWASDYYYPEFGPEKKWLVKHCQVWRCMYRTSVIRDIKFIEGIIYEDFPWWSEVMLSVRKTSIINLPLYFYYPNLQSIIFSTGQRRRIESLQIAIDATKKLYAEKATEKQLRMWEKNFLIPFKLKLEKKIKLYGKSKA